MSKEKNYCEINSCDHGAINLRLSQNPLVKPVEI